MHLRFGNTVIKCIEYIGFIELFTVTCCTFLFFCSFLDANGEIEYDENLFLAFLETIYKSNYIVNFKQYSHSFHKTLMGD